MTTKYKGCVIEHTTTTTTVSRRYGMHSANELRSLYRIAGRLNKPEGLRPFLTSLSEAREWITNEIWLQENRT